MHRRALLQTAMTIGGASMFPASALATEHGSPDESPLVDTNIHLFQWPFRSLPLDTTSQLVRRLQELGITQAWAGSYEALLHRNLTAVNARLAKACAQHRMLVPIGAINPHSEGWQEDLRQCVQCHRMPGIRLYPGYHRYSLADERLDSLLAQASQQGLFVQVVIALEDTRTQHPQMQVPDVDLQPLAAMMDKHAELHVQLLGARFTPQRLIDLAGIDRVYFDTARLDQTDALASVMQTAAAERVMLGSHAPLLIPEAVLIRLDEHPIDDAAIQRVTWRNAAAFRNVATAMDSRRVNER